MTGCDGRTISSLEVVVNARKTFCSQDFCFSSDYARALNAANMQGFANSFFPFPRGSLAEVQSSAFRLGVHALRSVCKRKFLRVKETTAKGKR